MKIFMVLFISVYEIARDALIVFLFGFSVWWFSWTMIEAFYGMGRRAAEDEMRYQLSGGRP